MDVGRAQLVRLTAAKAVLNTAMRWMPFFLPTLAIAFSTTTASLTTVLGFGEAAGLSTLLIGRWLDGGGERKIMVGALALAALSTGIALIGAPVIAVLINAFGWRAPFIVLAVLLAAMAVMIATTNDDSVPLADATTPVVRQPLTVDAWILIGASAAIAMTGLATIVIAGTWLDESLDVSTGGIGLVAMAFGAAEILGSSSSAAIADRMGPIQSTRLAMVLAIVGLLVITQAGSSLLIAALGLALFFLGFEYSIVSSFSIVSEAMPQARGRALAANSGFGTAARGGGIVLSGVLYESFGINGPVSLSLSAAIVALTLLTVGIRRSHRAA